MICEILDEKVLDEIRETVGNKVPETGGILGSSKKCIIDCFRFDEWAKTTGTTFYYDVEKMSEEYRGWLNKGISLTGIVHSHPSGACCPSFHDVSTALIHMEFLGTDFFYMPVVQVNPFSLYFYTIKKEENNLVVYRNFVINEGDDEKFIREEIIKIGNCPIEELKSYRKNLSDDLTPDQKMGIESNTDMYSRVIVKCDTEKNNSVIANESLLLDENVKPEGDEKLRQPDEKKEVPDEML